jgi:hypothetical protein
VETIVRCFFLVQNSRTTSALRQAGWDVEDYVNFKLQDGVNRWDQLPVFMRYQNKRLGLIADPEFLIISWYKKLENYDPQSRALLPAYPSDWYNALLTVDEIQQVLEMWIFKKMSMHNKTRAWAINLLKNTIPILYDLVYTPRGRNVLQVVYEMLMLINTDPDQGIQTRLRLVEMYQPLFKDIFPENSYATKVGLFFQGFPHPVFRPELIMTLFILEKYLFLPYTDRTKMYEFLSTVGGNLQQYTDTILWDFEKMLPKQDESSNIMVPVHFRFFPRRKHVFQKILDYHKSLYGHKIGVRRSDGSLDSCALFTTQEKEEIKKRLDKKRKHVGKPDATPDA